MNFVHKVIKTVLFKRFRKYILIHNFIKINSVIIIVILGNSLYTFMSILNIFNPTKNLIVYQKFLRSFASVNANKICFENVYNKGLVFIQVTYLPWPRPFGRHFTLNDPGSLFEPFCPVWEPWVEQSVLEKTFSRLTVIWHCWTDSAVSNLEI